MNTSRFTAGASRFAHFAGLSRKSRRAAAEDDQSDDGAGAEEDDDDMDAAEDDGDQEEPKGKKSRKAKGSDDDGEEDEEPKARGRKSRRAADDDDDGEEDEEPKARGRKSRRAADDEDGDEDAEEDDDKEEMTGRSAKASARRRERARCAAIFAHKSAANNIPLAMSLAFDTTMTRQEAIAVMRGQANRADATPPARSTREARNADLGAMDSPGGSKPKAGASWGRSFTKLGVAPRG